MNLIGVWNAAPDKHWNNFIISSSFPIFLIHIFFYTLSSAVVRIFKIEHIAYYTFIGCVVRFILIIVISLFVVHLLRSLFSRFAALVFGGR